MEQIRFDGKLGWCFTTLFLLALGGHILQLFQPWFVDEVYVLNNILHFFSEQTFIPKTTEYPTMASYVGAPFMAIGLLFHSLLKGTPMDETVAGLYFFDLKSLILPVRVMSLLALGLSAYFISKYLGRKYSVGTALIVGLLFFAQQAFAVRSAWAVPDILLVFFSTICMILLFEAVDSAKGKDAFFRSILLSSLFCGFAVSTKYNAAALTVPIAVAITIHALQIDKPVLIFLKTGSASLAAFLFGFFVGSPAWLVEPHLMLDGVNFQIDLAEKGHLGLSGIPIVTPLFSLVTSSPVLTFLAAFGLFLTCKNDRSTAIVSLAAVAAMLFLSTRTALQSQQHYIFPLYGMLSILAAPSLERLTQWGGKKTILASFLYITFLVFSQIFGATAYLTESSRETARNWIYHNIDAGETIAVDSMYLPKIYRRSELEVGGSKHYLLDFKSIRDELESAHKLYETIAIQHDREWLKETSVRYIMTNSRMYHRYFHAGNIIGREPDPYSDLGREYFKRKNFYAALFDETEFTILATLGGRDAETITIFARRDSGVAAKPERPDNDQ